MACNYEAEDGLGEEVLGDGREGGLPAQTIHYQLEHIQRLTQKTGEKVTTDFSLLKQQYCRSCSLKARMIKSQTSQI